MKLLVISHTPHYLIRDQIVGWGPTVIELSELACLFDELVHIAPLSSQPAPASALPYSSGRIRLRAVAPAGGDSLAGKLSVLSRVPDYVRAIRSEARRADAVHVRCPASISLVALMLLTLMRKPAVRWFKYAGNWQPTTAQPAAYRLQRWWLQKDLARGVVTVNGAWSRQPRHVLTFNNPCISEVERVAAARLAAPKQLDRPVRLLFIGRLDGGKGAEKVVRICQHLQAKGCDFCCDIVGDGELRAALEQQIGQGQMTGQIHLHGWLPKPALSPFYQSAQFILLPSTSSEGWPKVLSEAMAYGVVPLASAISSIPQVFLESGAGRSFAANDIHSYASAIQEYLNDPATWKAASDAGVAYARHFTYENYLRRVAGMFTETWKMPSLMQTHYNENHE